MMGIGGRKENRTEAPSLSPKYITSVLENKKWEGDKEKNVETDEKKGALLERFLGRKKNPSDHGGREK